MPRGRLSSPSRWWPSPPTAPSPARESPSAGWRPLPRSWEPTAFFVGLAPEDVGVASALADAVDGLPVIDDPRADADYRREVAAELAARAVRDAAARVWSGDDAVGKCGNGTYAVADSERGVPSNDGFRAAALDQEQAGDVEVALTLNGEHRRARVTPRTLLSDLVRGPFGLTATHVGCEHGVCGACNVLVDGTAVRSCLMLAVQADGRSVQTLEGLRDRPEVAALVDRFVAEHGLQCGFCTPGFIVTLAELRRNRAPATPEQPDRQRLPLHRLRADPARGEGPA